MKLFIKEGTKRIDYFQFSNRKDITELIIADTVEIIGNGAFHNCTNLKRITWGACVHSIGRHAFGRCVSLEMLHLPESIGWVGSHAFASCSSLVYVEFDDGDYVEIERAAFVDCTGLIYAIFPNGLKCICGETFSGCTKLEDIFIPDTVTSIDNSAFLGVAARQIELPYLIESIEDFAFSYTQLTSVIIPDRVFAIGNSAFGHCNDLRSVDIGESVVYIGKMAFSECPSLNEVTFRSTIIGSIGTYVFKGCKNLKRINVPASAMNTYKRLLPKYLHKKLVGF